MSFAENRADSATTGFPFGRLYTLILALSYLGVMTWTYAEMISPVWAYAGFTYKWPGQTLFGLAAVAALIPSLMLPTTVMRVRDFAIWVVYFALYVPAIVLPPVMGNMSANDSVALTLAMFLSFLIVCIPFAKAKPGKVVPLFRLSEAQFWSGFAVLYAILNVWVFAAFGSHLRLVSFQDIYAQRDVAGSIQRSSLVGYAIGILFGAFNPFVMAMGLTERRYKLFALGAMGQVFLFATAAMKSVVLSDFVIPVIFLLVFRKRPYRVSRIGLAVAASAIGLTLVGALFIQSDKGIFSIIFALVYIRTFCMVGVLMGTYVEFFLAHPLTYFSHIGVMQNFVRYPYTDALGNVIGNFMIPGSEVMDANASYLATDGMAALGIPGIVLSGLLFRGFIWLFDACATERTVPLACCALIPVLMSATNASMFTTLVTNGGAALAVILYTYSYAVRGFTPRHASPTRISTSTTIS